MRCFKHLIATFGVVVSFNTLAVPQYVFPFWDDTNADTISESMLFTDGDLNVTVSAWTSSFNSDQDQLENWQQVTGNDLGVFRDDNGLGVISSDNDGNDLDGGSSGNFADDPDEGLLLVFSQQVSIFDIFVGDLDSSDDINFSLVDLTNPASPVLTRSEIDLVGPAFESEWAFMFSPGFQGSAFMLWVDGSSDDVELLGVAVNKVPTPATLSLFALGLFAMLRRQK